MFINLPKAFPAQQPIFPADPVSPLVADAISWHLLPNSIRSRGERECWPLLWSGRGAEGRGTGEGRPGRQVPTPCRWAAGGGGSTCHPSPDAGRHSTGGPRYQSGRDRYADGAGLRGGAAGTAVDCRGITQTVLIRRSGNRAGSEGWEG